MCMPTFFLYHTSEAYRLSCFFPCLICMLMESVLLFSSLQHLWASSWKWWFRQGAVQVKILQCATGDYFSSFPRCDIYVHYIIFRKHASRVCYPFTNLGYFICRKDGSIFCIWEKGYLSLVILILHLLQWIAVMQDQILRIMSKHVI